MVGLLLPATVGGALANLGVSLAGLNLTQETKRRHGRHENQGRFLTQSGARYMFGVRYKF